MKLQLHCDNCGAIVFPGGSCRYCKAPTGHEIEGTDKRSALPTERLPLPRFGPGYLETIYENKYRLDAEARVLLDPDNQDKRRQDQVLDLLVDKYFPPGYYFGGTVGMNCWWAYSLGWERVDNKSRWEPVIQVWPIRQEQERTAI